MPLRRVFGSFFFVAAPDHTTARGAGCPATHAPAGVERGRREEGGEVSLWRSMPQRGTDQQECGVKWAELAVDFQAATHAGLTRKEED